MALFVVPLAITMMTAGYRRHRRLWIVAIGVLGISFVVVGAAMPYLENNPVSTSESTGSDDEVFVYVVGEEMEEEVCTDRCCPSLVTNEDGSMSLHIPPASLLTALGGIALIITHIGNLCTCSSCRKTSGCRSAKL